MNCILVKKDFKGMTQVVENHYKTLRYKCPYSHEEWEEEKILQRGTSYQEVLERIQEQKKGGEQIKRRQKLEKKKITYAKVAEQALEKSQSTAGDQTSTNISSIIN